MELSDIQIVESTLLPPDEAWIICNREAVERPRDCVIKDRGECHFYALGADGEAVHQRALARPLSQRLVKRDGEQQRRDNCRQNQAVR